MLILPLPILSYWSLNVISDDIVSPEAVPDPLKSNAKLNAPAFVTAICALDEVKDATAAEP